MQLKQLHIVSFDNPFPADYGGVVDVFYKLKALSELGVKIHLHCFEYGRKPSNYLDQICSTVNYYPRKTKLANGLSRLPYIVQSRISESLIQNLLVNDYPILVEGIHCCSVCLDSRLKNRFFIFRPSNIEHHYYRNLAKAETSFAKKVFFHLEAIKLKCLEKKLPSPNQIWGISETDTQYFKTLFPKSRVEHIPGFHSANRINCPVGMGAYALYHGHLGVAENRKAVRFLLKNVFSKLDYPLIISGKNPSKEIVALCKELKHVQLIENPDEASMFRLIQHAHIHVLPTFQNTGFKLKLIHALFNGRHVLVNSKMLNGTPFQSVCHLAEDAAAWVSQIEKLANLDFTLQDIAQRKAILFPNYSNSANAEKIKTLIFNSKN
ncbi:MAG TPA: mannosyltransferase [Bacteroidales bacterium]|nr:mannosyltransferase [Bacteroidales bacterium]